MKLFVFTFAIAVMVQASMAGPLYRHKRNDLFVDTFTGGVQFMKKTIPSVETLFENSLKDIPKTPAYAKYVQMLEKYLADMQEFKIKPGNCFEKNVAMFDKFVKFIQDMNKDMETPEAQEVDRILDNNGGLEMIKDFEEYGAKLDNPDVDKALENISPEDALKIAPLIIDVC